MTDFTREDMRERVARQVGDVICDQGWALRRRLTSDERLRIADAIMDELGLWEACEAIRDQRWAIRKLLAADEALELCEDLKGDLQMERRHAVQDCEDAVALAEESLARLRGETK